MFKSFHIYPNLICGISEKADGNLKLGAAKQDFERFILKRNLNSFKVFRAELVHGDRVVAIDNLSPEEIILNCDGLVTKEKNILLTATFADCFPVYFYDPVSGIAGLAHCGWRGIISGLANKMILAMGSLGSQPEDIVIGIGPGIQRHHFEIKDDIVSWFKNYPEQVLKKDGKMFVDLSAIVKAQLISSGIIPTNIETSKDCTYCDKDKYFSFRRDKPNVSEAMLGYIGLK